MLVIRWFAAFRRVDNPWKSLIWELTCPDQKAAEWVEPRRVYEYDVVDSRDKTAIQRAVTRAKREGRFVAMQDFQDRAKLCTVEYRTTTDHVELWYEGTSVNMFCESLRSRGIYVYKSDYSPGYHWNLHPYDAYPRGAKIEIVKVKPYRAWFNIDKFIGFAYAPSNVVKKFESDVWSERGQDLQSDRLIATRTGNESWHSECWVSGTPNGIVVMPAHSDWAKKVVKQARALAKMYNLPVYQLILNNGRHALKRVS